MTGPMKIGMTLPVMEPALDRELLLDWIERIDNGPFSSLCFGERIAFSNPEVITLLGAAAAMTRRVRLVTTVIVAPLHDPVMLAKQLATADMLSGGRLSVGLGVGGREEDYRAVGVDLSRRKHSVLATQVARMRLVWSGEIPAPGLLRPVEPLPAQSGGLELLAGAMGPKALALAAPWADGVAGFSFGASVSDIETSFSNARVAWTKAGRERPPRLVTSFWYALGDGAREQLDRHLRRYLNWLPAAEVEAMLPHTGFAGSGADLLGRIAQVAATGADELMLIPTTSDPDEVTKVAELLLAAGAAGEA